MRGLIVLVWQIGVQGLEKANKGGCFSRTADDKRVGRAGRVERAKGKEIDLLLLTELKPKKLE